MNYQIFCALAAISSLAFLIAILCSKNGRKIKFRRLITYTTVNIFLFGILAFGLYKLQDSEYEYSHFEYDKTIEVNDIYYGNFANDYFATVEDTVRRQIEGGSKRTLISVIMPPRLHSSVGDRRLLAVSPHNVVALFQEHASCF